MTRRAAPAKGKQKEQAKDWSTARLLVGAGAGAEAGAGY
jgi:hypothetical protein